MEIKEDDKKIMLIFKKIVLEIALKDFNKYVGGDSSGGGNKNYKCDNSQTNDKNGNNGNGDDVVCIPKRKFHRTKLTATVTAYVVSIGSLIVLLIEFITVLMK